MNLEEILNQVPNDPNELIFGDLTFRDIQEKKIFEQTGIHPFETENGEIDKRQYVSIIEDLVENFLKSNDQDENFFENNPLSGDFGVGQKENKVNDILNSLVSRIIRAYPKSNITVDFIRDSLRQYIAKKYTLALEPERRVKFQKMLDEWIKK